MNLLRALVEPASARFAFVLSLVTLSLVPLQISWSGETRGGFRIDEAHKISESAFLPLWLRHDWRNPAWTANLVDRSNPPVGKYLFGAAIALAGKRIPHLPTLSVHATNGMVPPNFPPELSRPYESYLASTRRVGVVCTALTAAIVVWFAARIAGVAGALTAIAFFLTNFVTRVYGPTAIFDPILTFLATALLAVAVAAALASNRRRFVVLMGAAGVIGALAFQTRLNGLLFFGVTFLVVLTKRRSLTDTVIGTAMAATAFVAVTFAVNPYYWPDPIGRFSMQVSDLRYILSQCKSRLTTVGEKSGYAWEVVCGDLPGLLLLFVALGGVSALIVRWRKLNDDARLTGLWSVIVVVTFVLWMPVPVPRYLLVTIPPLCCLAAIGCDGAIAGVRAAIGSGRYGA